MQVHSFVLKGGGRILAPLQVPKSGFFPITFATKEKVSLFSPVLMKQQVRTVGKTPCVSGVTHACLGVDRKLWEERKRLTPSTGERSGERVSNMQSFEAGFL